MMMVIFLLFYHYLFALAALFGPSEQSRFRCLFKPGACFSRWGCLPGVQRAGTGGSSRSLTQLQSMPSQHLKQSRRRDQLKEIRTCREKKQKTREICLSLKTKRSNWSTACLFQWVQTEVKESKLWKCSHVGVKVEVLHEGWRTQYGWNNIP